MTMYQNPLDRFEPGAMKPVTPVADKSQAPFIQQNSQSEVADNDPLSKFSKEKFAPESVPEYGLRRGSQLASVTAERGGGLVGDVKNAIKDLVIGSYENATLSSGDYTSNTPKKQREAPSWLRNMFESKPALGFDAPTSAQLQEVSEKATGGYTKPRTPEEKFTRNLFGDIVSSFGPGATRGYRNNLLIPFGANIIGEGVRKYTKGDETKATIAQTGAYFLLGLMNNANASTFARTLRQDAQQQFGNQRVNGPQLNNNVSRSVNRFLANTDSTVSSRKHVRGILTDLRQGRDTVNNLIERVVEINDDIASGGGFGPNVKATSAASERAVRHLNTIKDNALEAIEQAGQRNPGAWDLYRQSNSAWSAILASNRIRDWASRHYGKLASAGAAALVGLNHYGEQFASAGGAAKGAAIVGTTLAGHKLFQVLYRIRQSPELRGYYGRMLAATAANNIPQYTAALSKLDHALAKEEEETKKLRKPKNQ